MKITSAILILSFFTATVSAEDKPSASSGEDKNALVVDLSAPAKKNISYMICRHGKDVRTIQVNNKKEEGCTVSYIKAGVESTVADSKWKGRCFDVLRNIQSNLEKSNWSCKDISDARVSSVDDGL